LRQVEARKVPHQLAGCGDARGIACDQLRKALFARAPERVLEARVDELPELAVALFEAFENIALGTTIVSYALYTVAPETVAWFHTDGLLATVPIVVFGLFRWRLIEARGGGEDAATDLFTDPGLLATVVTWGTVCAVLIYGPGRT